MWLRDKDGRICGKVNPPGPKTEEEVAAAQSLEKAKADWYRKKFGGEKILVDCEPFPGTGNQHDSATEASNEMEFADTPDNNQEDTNMAQDGAEAAADQCAAEPSPPTEHIVTGLPREEALRIYAASVNQPDTLFSFDPVLPGRLDQLRGLMHDPISADEAKALNDVLYRREWWTDMINWLQDDPVSWENHFAREIFRAEEEDRQYLEERRQKEENKARGISVPGVGFDEVSPLVDDPELVELRKNSLARAKTYYLPVAQPCPQCGTPAEFLEWLSDGGEVKTHCRFCLQQVDEFVEYMVSYRSHRSARSSRALHRHYSRRG